MASSSPHHRTIRSSSLGNYSYYRSSRHINPAPKPVPFIAASPSRLIPRKLLAVLVLAVAVAGFQLMHNDQAKQPAASQTSKASPPPVKAAAVAAPVAKPADECAGNGSGKLILVDISQRHLWACNGAKTAYDSPVITGMSAYASTVTPTGTYHVHSKQTNLTLTGSDITGSWSDPVRYWMPFLNNKYGTYGFHDATWRSSGSFGKVSPDSSKASHGCVELPLSAAAWLYQWTPVGTPVTIKN